MKVLKDYGFFFLKFMGLLLGYSLIMSILYYFFFSGKVVSIISMVYFIFIFLFFGYKEGKKVEKKGFLAGLKIGLFFIFSLFLMDLFFFHSPWKWIRMIYYIIFLFSSILGSTIGINTKKE